MSADAERERQTSGGERSLLERNRYFYGKLMTPRDMQAEQAFHRARLDTLARTITGVGIVHGLDIKGVRELRDSDGDSQEVELEVTVTPGVAVDGQGRVLVLETTERREFPVPEGDELHVYLRYHETETERVPTPDLGRAVTEGCEFNRVVESPEVVYLPPRDDADRSHKPVPVVDADTDVAPPSDEQPDPDDVLLSRLARSYHEAFDDLPTDDEPAVFLGVLTRSGGEWQVEGKERRPLVYTNDMLYAALVRHLFAENPHRVTGGGSGDGEVPEALREQVDELQATVGTLIGQVEDLGDRLQHGERRTKLFERYVIDRSLELAVDAFYAVEEEFDSEVAKDITKQVMDRVERKPELEPDEYVEFVGSDLLRREVELQSELKRDATESSLDRYREALDALEKVLEAERKRDKGEREVLRVVLAQDRVNETARWLRIRLAAVG